MDIVFGYLAGLLTLINPCVLPVIPFALASAVSSGPKGPLLLAAGMTASFTALGVLTASIGPAIGISADTVSQAGALVMIVFGAVLLVPRLGGAFAFATAGLADGAAHRLAGAEQGGSSTGQLVGGMLLGAVWAPCIGPTLGGAIALASQGTGIGRAAAIMFAFSLGVSTIILALAYGTREAIASRREGLRRLAEWSKPLMGIVFICVGLAIYFGLEPVIVEALLDLMPTWLQDLSVSI